MDVEKDIVETPAVERSPRTHVDSQPLPTDSMVTVPLSESDGATAADSDDNVSPTTQRPEIVIENRLSSRPNSAEIMEAFGRPSNSNQDEEDTVDEEEKADEEDKVDEEGRLDEAGPTISLPKEEVPESPLTPTHDRSRSDSSSSNQSAHVDWAELDKKEEQEPGGQGQDDVS
jgi:hypothetical protein